MTKGWFQSGIPYCWYRFPSSTCNGLMVSGLVMRAPSYTLVGLGATLALKLLSAFWCLAVSSIMLWLVDPEEDYIWVNWYPSLAPFFNCRWVLLPNVVELASLLALLGFWWGPSLMSASFVTSWALSLAIAWTDSMAINFSSNWHMETSLKLLNTTSHRVGCSPLVSHIHHRSSGRSSSQPIGQCISSEHWGWQQLWFIDPCPKLGIELSLHLISDGEVWCTCLCCIPGRYGAIEIVNYSPIILCFVRRFATWKFLNLSKKF